MTTSAICCTHEQLRIDSPEPPARPLAAIDGIFAAAVLPEDHPHALRFPERKPETDSAIVQSPSITSKIKLQFQRKSVKNLKKGREYDEDARQMTLQEVLNEIETRSDLHEPEREKSHQHDFGDVPAVEKSRLSTPRPISPDVRYSVLNSLGYLQPLLQKTSDEGAAYPAQYPVNATTLVTAQPTVLNVSNSGDIAAPTLSRSCSSPALLLSRSIACTPLTRSRSENDFGQFPLMVTPRIDSLSENVRTTEKVHVAREAHDAHSNPESVPMSALHVREPTTTNSSEVLTPFPDYEEPELSASDDVPHLHKMDISQQLRCTSQMSEIGEDGTHACPVQRFAVCTGTHPELYLSSGRGRKSRQKSSSGIDSASGPLCWGRVCSPVHDAASSIYSRPVSPISSISECNVSRRNVSPEEPLSNLDAIFADWPLKSAEPPAADGTASDTLNEMVSTVASGSKALLSMPVDVSPESGSSSSFTTPTDDGDAASVRFLPLPRKPTPIPSKSSSSILTKGSKQSRFLERFSPPTKLVRKRLSVFKFLRPGSRKQQVRSISSPILNATTIVPKTQLDGEADDPALLTIQYELRERPSQVVRSVSTGQLGVSSVDSGGLLAPGATLERRPTLADYERNLSVVGDDRRRRSSVNIQRAKEIEEHDRRESVSVRRKLSRARSLRDDASPLMTQALEKHQQEKALFRSASKQRDSLKEVQPAPSFGSSIFVDTGSSLSASIPSNYSDLLDPLEKGQLIGTKRDADAGQFLMPPVHGPGSSRRSSVATTTRVPSTKASVLTRHVQAEPRGGKRIGTSLESWSRYPSHTRSERSGPAGSRDAVISRDFAMDINPDEIHVDEHAEDESPIKRHLGDNSSPRSKSAAPSTRSVTFSSIMRYYSNLFHTRGWHGQNRRTSVTLGGPLESPELEMLPPQTSAEATISNKHSEHFKRLEVHLKEEADKLKHYLKEEETKVQDYVKREEGKLEDFVKQEEHKLEDFVKKEEGKLKEFVQEEEDKFTHSHDHHHRDSSRHSSHSSQRKLSPFRTGSIFEGPSHQTNDELKRPETTIGPNDGVSEKQIRYKMPDSRLTLDGSTEAKEGTPSKAAVWSALYKECLFRPISRGATEVENSTAKEQNQSRPPPKLKPVKPRTPEKPKTLDPKASVRRFPSVTVIDDQKGHSRSISLVSVQTRKSTNFEWSSTHEMVELIQAREQEERDKLLTALQLAR